MNEHCKIFVGGLSWHTTIEKLSAYFNTFGDVVEVNIMTNPETGKSRGFAFVTFKDPSSVQNVLTKSPHHLDGRNIDPKECNIRNCVKLKKDTNFCKVFVGGLPHDIKDDVLKDFFSKYGTVTEVVIMYDQEKKKTRGFGFITFDSEETVNKLVEERFLMLNGKKIEIKKAEPQRPTMLRSNSSSMTNISIQSSHNGYLSGLSPYVPLSAQHHQLHAAATAHHVMQPPNQVNQNLDTSFQFAYHPNGYSTTIPLHHNAHHTRTDNLANTSLIAGYAPTAMQITSTHQPPSHQLVSQPWPLTHHPNQLGHLHTIQAHHSNMQTSPTASNITSHQSILQTAGIQGVQMSIIQQQQSHTTGTNLSRPNTPSSTPNNSNLQQQIQQSQTPLTNQSQNNVNLAQLNTPPQPSLTPQQNWYPPANHPYSFSTPVPPHSLGTTTSNLISASNASAAPIPVPQTSNPAFSQAITFGYPATAYVPTAGLTHWQNPYIYGAYPIPYQTAPSAVNTTSSPPAIVPSQSITPQGTYK